MTRRAIKAMRKMQLEKLWIAAISTINADKATKKATWDRIKSLKLLADIFQPSKIPRVMDPNTGKKAVTDKRNGEIIAQFPRMKHSQDSHCDLTHISELATQPVMYELNNPPSTSELQTAILLPKNSTFSGPNAPQYDLLKAVGTKEHP